MEKTVSSRDWEARYTDMKTDSVSVLVGALNVEFTWVCEFRIERSHLLIGPCISNTVFDAAHYEL